MNTLVIETNNHGQLVLSSTYWGSDYELAGKLFCSVNAGAIRVLIPRTQRKIIEECRSAAYAILSRGSWPERGLSEAVEIMWEDHSDSPYALHLSPESFDLLPAQPTEGREWLITLWDWKKNRPHKAAERRCYWRRVPKIPYLKPWGQE